MAKQFLQGLQFSLREMFFLTAFAAIGMAAMKYGGVLSLILRFFTMIAITGAIAFTFEGRNQSRAFSRSFILCLFVYALTLNVAGIRELHANGYLPTSKAIANLYFISTGAKHTYFFSSSQSESYYNIDQDSFAPSLKALNRPSMADYFIDGHILWALLFGYLGGKLAVWVCTQHIENKQE